MTGSRKNSSPACPAALRRQRRRCPAQLRCGRGQAAIGKFCSCSETECALIWLRWKDMGKGSLAAILERNVLANPID